MDILDALKAPFPPDAISWRVGATNKDKTKGIALAYIDARDVMTRFDEVCGLDWQCRYSHVTDKGVVCEIGVKIDGEWRWRSNGAGETDVEGEKGAMSDAFKRAAVLWGVGRYLYDLPNEWVELDEYKRLKRTPNLPKWATPDGSPRQSDVQARALAQNEAYMALKKAVEAGDALAVWTVRIGDETAYKAAFGVLDSKGKKAARELEVSAPDLIRTYVETLTDHAAHSDDMGAMQLWGEMSKSGKALVWRELDETTKAFIKALKEAA